jgi:hypothetical protein
VIGRGSNFTPPAGFGGVARQGFRIDIKLAEWRTLPAVELQLKVKLSDVPPIGTLQSPGASGLTIHPHPYIGRIGQYLTSRAQQPPSIPKKRP